MNDIGGLMDQKVETWEIGRLTPYPGNPRKIGDDAVAAVAESLRRYGWQQPIVVDAEGVIVVGHTRHLAAKSLGMDTVPVQVARMTQEKVDEYRLVDNKTGELSQWDYDALAVEVREFDEDLVEDFFPDVDMEISSIEDSRGDFSEEKFEKAQKEAETIKPQSEGMTHTTDVVCPSCSNLYQVRTLSLPGVTDALIKALSIEE